MSKTSGVTVVGDHDGRAPRVFETLLLSASEVKAYRDDFEVVGVFNPGVAQLADEVVLLVRVAERPREQRSGYTALPRWESTGDLTVDWVPDDDLEPVDARIVRWRDSGLFRLTFTSHLLVVRCGDGRSIRSITDVRFLPGSPLEEFGVEDPRITRLDDRYYFTYVAVSRHGAATALASTRDFVSFERHGIVFCPENKDVVLFPERVGGDYVALHRPNGGTPFCRPEMWVARSRDLTHWGRHDLLNVAGGAWQSGRVGAGPPPIKVPQGWLCIYHGNQPPAEPGAVGTYSSGALLLDADEPTRILQRTEEPFFVPEADFERHGFVPDVVFPTGIVQADGQLLVYYGAADSSTAVVAFDLSQILESLR